MSIRIGPNIALQGILRNLSESTERLSQITQRLSSGMRINGASVDPANLGLSQRLEADARLYTRALQNVNDGVSLLSITQGALEALQSISQRQAELALQASSAHLNTTQRQALNQELNSLVSEYNRIVTTTEFNGIKLLDGSMTSLGLHVGPSADDTINFQLGQAFTRSVGDLTYQPMTTFNVGTNPNSMITADLNGDGILDIATTNEGSANISILLGNGDGTFQAQQTYATADAQPNSLNVADLNNDGALDLVANNFGTAGRGDTASIFINNGDGTFQPAYTIAAGLGPVALTIADVNNDGNLDISTASAGANFVSGLPEITQITLPNAGTYEITNLVFSAAPVQEVSTISTVDVQNGVQEVTVITADVGPVQEVTTVMFDAIGVAESAQIKVDSIGAKQVSQVTMDGISTQEVTELTMEEGANLTSGDYFTINSASDQYYVWYNVDGAGADPAIAGRTGIEVAVNSTDTASDVATKTAAALDGSAGFSAASSFDVVTVTNSEGGAVADAADGSIGGAFAAAVVTQGTTSDIQNGDYFTLDSPTGSYYVWFDIGNSGADPMVAGKTGIKVDVNYGDTADEVAEAVRAALEAQTDFTASRVGNDVTITNLDVGSAPAITSGNISGSTFAVSTLIAGTDTDIQNGDYFTVSSPNGDYYVWFNIDGRGTDPTLAGMTGIEVSVNAGDTALTVAERLRSALDAHGDFSASRVGDVVTLNNLDVGAVADIDSGTIGTTTFSVSTLTQGTDTDIQSGDYFTFDTPDTNYYVWFSVDGRGSDPGVAGRTGIRVDVSAGDSELQVVAAVFDALSGASDFEVIGMPSAIAIRNTSHGAVADATTGTLGTTNFGVSVTTQGVSSAIQNGDYFLIDSPDGSYYAWFDIDDTGVDPNVAGRTGIEIDITAGATADAVAEAIRMALDGMVDFTATRIGDQVTVTNVSRGAAADASAGTITGGNFGLSTTVQGQDDDIQSGDYFYLSAPGTDYYVWFNVDGAGGNPAIAGRTGIEVALNSSDTDAQVASKLAAAIDAVGDFSAAAAGAQVTVTNVHGGAVTNITDQTVGGAFGVSTTTDGSNSSVENSDYFLIDTPSNQYYVWFDFEGLGVDPMVAGRTGVKVDVNYGDDASTIAAAVRSALSTLGDVDITGAAATVTITNTEVGDSTVTGGTIAGLPITTLAEGTSNQIVSGQYFELNSSSGNYYVWYNVDGAGGNPFVAGRTGIQVNISDGDSAAAVAAATAAAIDARAELNASSSNGTVTVTDVFNGPVNDAQNVNVGGTTVTVTQSGADPSIDVILDTISVPGHNFHTGQLVRLTTSGVLPGSLATNTDYFVIVNDGNTIQLATSQANAQAGIAIDITNFGSGVHSIVIPGQSTSAGFVLGNGDGTFGAVTEFSAGEAPSYFITADLNHDGNTDFILADTASDSVEVQLGSGTGNFTTIGNFAAGVNPQQIIVGDFDNDLNLDIVSADYGTTGTGNTVSVLLGNGDGTLQSGIAATTGTGVRSVAAADLNGDGILDLVTADEADGTVTILQGNGDGTFTSAGALAAGSSPGFVTIGDYNGDGIADLAVANTADNTVGIFLGNSEQVSTISEMSLMNVETSRAALATVQENMKRISDELGNIGAAMSRLEHTASHIARMRQELQTAEQRITAVDVAEEMANLIAEQVRREATTAVLAQGSRIDSQIVLRLLSNL